MIKTFTIAIISFGLGAALTYFLIPESGQAPGAATAPIAGEKRQNSNPSPVSVYTDYIHQLEELNRQLTKDLQAARNTQPAPAGDKIADQAQPQVDAAQFENYYHARKNSEEFNQYLQTISTANGPGYVKDLAAKFDAEVVDSQWAADYETRLHSLLESEAVSGSITPQSIVCKSRRCQINVAIADAEQANQVMQAFSAAINNNQLAIDKSMVVSAPDINAGVMSLYLARDASVKIHE